MTTEAIVGAAVTTVLGLFGGGAIVALINRRRMNAEAGSVEISGHMEIVDRTMDWNKLLLEQNEALTRRIDELEKKLDKQISELESDKDQLRERCRRLESEVEKLERENTDLRNDLNKR